MRPCFPGQPDPGDPVYRFHNAGRPVVQCPVPAVVDIKIGYMGARCYSFSPAILCLITLPSLNTSLLAFTSGVIRDS